MCRGLKRQEKLISGKSVQTIQNLFRKMNEKCIKQFRINKKKDYKVIL